VVGWLQCLDNLFLSIFVVELLFKVLVRWRNPQFWHSHAIQVILVVLFGLDFILLRYVVQHPPMANMLNVINRVSLLVPRRKVYYNISVERIGPLTFLLALGRQLETNYAYPEENVVLG